MKYLELFKDGFDSTITEKIKPENWPYVGYSLTKGFAFSIVPKENHIDVRILQQLPIPTLLYNSIDLGLPSGTLWADRNVGACTPYDSGAYFSWASTNGVIDNGITSMTLKEFIYFIAKINNIPDEEVEALIAEEGWEVLIMEEFNRYDGFVTNWFFNDENAPYYNGENFTKYNIEDDLITLLPEDDAAVVHMGSDWRMPSPDEMIELLQNTDLYYISLDGNVVAGPHVFAESISDTALDGSKLRSLCLAKRGEVFDYNNRTNFIEFPFAGEIDVFLLQHKNIAGFMWTNSRSDYVEDALFLPFVSNGTFNTGSVMRRIGRSVRGVRA